MEVGGGGRKEGFIKATEENLIWEPKNFGRATVVKFHDLLFCHVLQGTSKTQMYQEI